MKAKTKTKHRHRWTNFEWWDDAGRWVRVCMAIHCSNCNHPCQTEDIRLIKVTPRHRCVWKKIIKGFLSTAPAIYGMQFYECRCGLRKKLKVKGKR